MPGMASRKNPFPACAAVVALCAAAPAPPVAANSPPAPFDAKALQAAIDATPDGGTVRLPDGEIRLARSISVVGRTNLTVRGGAGTVLVLRYSPWEEPVGLITPHILVKGCSGVSFEGFRVTTDNPVNASGRVVSKNPADGTYEAEIDPRFPITGWEHVYGSDTFDEEGMPDYAIETYDDRNVRTELLPDGKGGVRAKATGLAYEVVGPQRIRVRAPDAAALGRLRVGHRVLYRYTIYGHSVFVVDASRDTAFRDIGIERCPSFGSTIRPLSENVLFERFCIQAPDGDPALYAANADGIHVVGLVGRLVMRGCRFRGLGDDALNVHAKAAEIESFDPATGALSVACRDPGGGKARLPRGWARPGDALAVYDAATLLPKGRLSVTSWRDSGRGVAPPGGDAAGIAPGDFVANERDFPSVEIEDCSVENSRARGFLLQTRHVRVRGCAFRGLALPAVLVAPDFRHWFEAGPAEDVEISGCTFEKCGMNGSPANLGAVTVKTSHDAGPGNCPAGVHRDLRIVGNAFRGCGAGGVYVESASGVEVRDNAFEDVWRNPPPGAGADRRPVRLVRCDGIRTPPR